MTAPAPAGPYGPALSAFVGLNPVGGWTLFVVDDEIFVEVPPPVTEYALDAGAWTIARLPPSRRAVVVF